MENIDLNIENEFLPTDLEEAYTLTFWRNYCMAEMDKCLNMQDEKGARHWSLDHQRAVNELDYLKFKKTDSERKKVNEKRNEGA